MSGLPGDQVQLDLLRRATPERRLRAARSLSATVIGFARRAIAEQFPQLDDIGRDVKFVEINYGRDLAHRLEAFLRQRASCRAR